MIVCDICFGEKEVYQYGDGHICRKCFLKQEMPTVEDFCRMQDQGWKEVVNDYLNQ